MKTKIRLLVLILLIGGGAYYYWQTQQSIQSEPPVLQLYGNVDIREVELAFRQPGRLTTMLVDEGATVQTGDLLARLDDRPYRDNYAAVAAEVALATAQLEKLNHGNRPQEIQQARQVVKQAEAQLRKSESDLQRQTGLTSTGAVSQKVLEMVRLGNDQAKAALTSARQTLSLMREGARSEDIAIAAAKLDAVLAAQSRAQMALDDAQLFAPSDGVISARVREPGSMVSSRDAVYTLSLRQPLYVRAYIGETELGRIAPGRAVTLHSDSTSTIYHGQVGFISPRAEFTPRAVETESLRTDLVYRLRIVVSDGDDALRQGMPVTIQLAEK